MSNEILKALMQLFAIIAKQDDGASQNHRRFVESFLKFQLAAEKVEEYIALYDHYLTEGDKETEALEENQENATAPGGRPKRSLKLASVKDLVRALNICKQINTTLTQKQKAVVLVRLLEMLKTENQFTSQRLEIISTVSTVFNLPTDESYLIEDFAKLDDLEKFDETNLLTIYSHELVLPEGRKSKHVDSEGLDGYIAIIRIPSVDLYFMKYRGHSEIFLNGLIFDPKKFYLLPPGSTIRLPQGTVYYSDVVARFLSDKHEVPISLEAKNLNFKFPNGKVALQDINISETSGKLIALMGASGAGKTTLLNVLSGIEKPSEGEVLINSINLHKSSDKIKGIVGYVAQDDLLIEELTVFENLYFNARLCFNHLSDGELRELVDKVLNNLGLLEVKEVVVGNPLNKKISGGQRKRLNIALELIREPSVLFVDEPTSGLSSRDSENVMDLLKELSLKGKLIFVVIHQPSSDIYKMFDKLFLLDVGGFPIYYGNPIEAIMFFKHETNQANADIGECHTCGNVNPELLFNLVEAKTVDEYGRFTAERKVKPKEWYDLFKDRFKPKTIETFNSIPDNILKIPGKLGQYTVFLLRDLKAKLSNNQYLALNLLEAPVLALILSVLIRFTSDPEHGTYTFFENENIPAYMFICIVVSLFIGLTVSAEEIFKDRKILKRERFLSLSKGSYLMSKITILFTLSAIQALTFVLIGNFVLGIKGMVFSYWLILFTTSCFANLMGLNISISFNSAVTIYILIPLLVIPQMILGGAMFSFDKINHILGGGKDRTPLISDFFASRWAFEAMAVNQFKNNAFEKQVYILSKKESMLNYKESYYIPKLQEIEENAKTLIENKSDSAQKALQKDLDLLKAEISAEMKENPAVKFEYLDKLTSKNYDRKTSRKIDAYFDDLNTYYSEKFNQLEEEKNTKLYKLQDTPEKTKKYLEFRNTFTNDNLHDLVTNNLAKKKVKIENGRLVQNVDNIYKDPTPKHRLDFRAHQFAPRKFFAGKYFSTFGFNLMVIWFMTLVLYLALFFEWLPKFLNLFDRSRFKFGNE